MKITKRQLKRIIKEEKRKLLKEAYPVSGGPSATWTAFENAVNNAALPMIDAGMELDGVQQAMHDSIDEIFAAYDNEPEWDEADQDNANQEWINQHGDPYNEGTSIEQMPAAWRQILGNSLKGKK
jgi:hypothetical protein